MRACWDESDFQRAARGDLRFAADDAAVIPAAVGRQQ